MQAAIRDADAPVWYGEEAQAGTISVPGVGLEALVERQLSERRRPAAPAAAQPVAQRVLVVDGDRQSRDSAAVALLEAGFEVSLALTAAAAVRALRGAAVDLIIVGAPLPDRSGVDLVRELRRRDDTPVIMLGAGDVETERLLGLDLGADDYVARPFTWSELASRARAILRGRRRDETAIPSVHEVGSLRIDLSRHEVRLGERSIAVTASQFRLLALLGGDAGAVFTRRRIMEHLWAGPYFGDGHPVDTHVLNLRRKLEAEPARPRRLLTVRGVGFKLVVPESEAV